MTSAAQTRPPLWEAAQTLAQLRASDPAPPIVEQMISLRRDLVERWLEMPGALVESAYQGQYAQAQQLLLTSKGQEIPLRGEDARLAARIRELIAEEGAPPAALIAAMLLCKPHDLELWRQLPSTPLWLLPDVLAFALTAPELFTEIGEADRYVEAYGKLVSAIHQIVVSANAGEHEERRDVSATVFTQRANLLQCYFNDRNLKALYEQRGDILEEALRRRGAKIDHTFVPRQRKKTRLGILSLSFSPGTEGFFALANFEHLDRDVFEIILYELAANNTPFERYCAGRADSFKVLHAGDPNTWTLQEVAEVVASIRADDLDVLLLASNLTVAAHPATLLALHRLARVQVSTMSSPVTTGMRNVDYLLTSPCNEPASGAQTHYREKLLTIDRSLNCFAYDHDHGGATIGVSRASEGIPPDAIVFASGANFYKILPEVEETWARLLARVPGSVLLLYPFNPNWSGSYGRSAFLSRLASRFHSHGISTDRLCILAPVPSRQDIHGILRLADVYLDTYPFAGSCSLVDPLTVGCPPVARRGATARSLHGASILRTLGLDELIADDEEAYVSKAAELAAHPELRAELSARIQVAMAGRPLTDTRPFSLAVGDALQRAYAAYEQVWRRREAAGHQELMEECQALADTLISTRAPLQGLVDTEIVRLLIHPYFQALDAGDDRGRSARHMVDVGACYGSMALPFLGSGWSADLFEPDPASRGILESNLRHSRGAAHVHPYAVSDTAASAIFYKNAVNGLSGLDRSPYGAVERLFSVQTVRLGEFLRSQGRERVDLLKIDTEGHDFKVLESHDFDALAPRLVLTEFGLTFKEQSFADVQACIDRMSARGYNALVFEYDDDGGFARGNWRHRLTALCATRPYRPERETSFGNILFYRRGDTLLFKVLSRMLSALGRFDADGALGSDAARALPGTLPVA